jgi:methyl coenzyme M reductase alpha subunit
MNERLVVISGTCVNPAEAGALAALDHYFNVPCDLTVVYVCASADTDDAGATFDLNDDATDTTVLAVDMADKEDPGEWISTHFGGSETPFVIAAGSEMSVDVNAAAAETTVHYAIWCLTGETVS